MWDQNIYVYECVHEEKGRNPFNVNNVRENFVDGTVGAFLSKQ